jgi:hypothetical protein
MFLHLFMVPPFQVGTPRFRSCVVTVLCKPGPGSEAFVTRYERKSDVKIVNINGFPINMSINANLCLLKQEDSCRELKKPAARTN